MRIGTISHHMSNALFGFWYIAPRVTTMVPISDDKEHTGNDQRFVCQNIRRTRLMFGKTFGSRFPCDFREVHFWYPFLFWGCGLKLDCNALIDSGSELWRRTVVNEARWVLAARWRRAAAKTTSLNQSCTAPIQLHRIHLSRGTSCGCWLEESPDWSALIFNRGERLFTCPYHYSSIARVHCPLNRYYLGRRRQWSPWFPMAAFVDNFSMFSEQSFRLSRAREHKFSLPIVVHERVRVIDQTTSANLPWSLLSRSCGGHRPWKVSRDQLTIHSRALVVISPTAPPECLSASSRQSRQNHGGKQQIHWRFVALLCFVSMKVFTKTIPHALGFTKKVQTTAGGTCFINTGKFPWNLDDKFDEKPP